MIAGLAEALDPALQRPRLRRDAEIAERSTRWGDRDSIVHAPGTPYLRLVGDEVDVVRRLDGNHAVAQLCADDLSSDAGLALSEVTQLVTDLHAANLLDTPPVDVYSTVVEKLRSRGARRRARVARMLHEQTAEIRNADSVVSWIYRHGGRALFTPLALVVVAGLGIGGLVVLLAASGTSVTGDVSGGGAVALFLLLLGALLCHELAHALAVKQAGRRVVAAGFRLYLGHPAFFIDSTDLVFATPRQRAVNAAAGPVIEGAIAGLAAIVVWLAPDLAGAHDLRRFAILAYLNVGLNLIPFIELDGYWLLTDLLDTPRLRARSFAVLRHEVPARLRRARPAFTRSERALAVFGVLGLVFTVGALAFAFATWLPIARELARAAWASGAVGRIAAVLILALVAGPLAQLGLGAARRVGATVAGVAANLRFRLQSSWRVAAAESLAALPTVGDMDDDTLSDLAGRVGRRRIRRRTTVVRQGEPANEFFVVRRGIFEIVERDQSGGDRLLRRVGPGESFGELALLEGRVRTASVRASTDGELFVFDAGTFKRLLAPAMSRPALAPALGPALEVQALAPFRGLSLEDAALIAAQAEHFDVPAGSDVVREGDVADGFFVLRAGQAIVEREGVRVATLRAGDHFGELALLHDSRRQATVRTVTPASVLRIDDDLFHRLVAGAMTRQSDHVAGRELGGEFT